MIAPNGSLNRLIAGNAWYAENWCLAVVWFTPCPNASIVQPISRNSAIVSGAQSALNASRSPSGKWIKSHPSTSPSITLDATDQALTIEVDLNQERVALRAMCRVNHGAAYSAHTNRHSKLLPWNEVREDRQ
jgi:hypothetical protein